MSFLDISEYLISASQFLLFGIPMHVLLHKAIERDDVRVKRGNEGDVSKLNPPYGGVRQL
jgi:hypothetical protein